MTMILGSITNLRSRDDKRMFSHSSSLTLCYLDVRYSLVVKIVLLLVNEVARKYDSPSRQGKL